MASINALTSTLTRQQAAHLLRRTSFGPTKEEIDTFTGLDVNTAISNIIQDYTEPIEAPLDIATNLNWVSPKPTDANSEETDLMDFLMASWLELMRNKGGNIMEKMTHFFHTHFTTKKSKVESSTAIYYQLALFRHFGLGNFKTLSKKICTDNAMIRFLDSNSNVYGSPQENYAREFLELYTIGKGLQVGADDYTNYSEKDIQEAAKILSGYDFDQEFTNIDPETELPRGIIKTNNNLRPQALTDRASQHDETVKTFNGTLGNGGTTITPEFLSGEFATIESVYGELDELVDMIFTNDETAKAICRELYRYFVYYEISDEIEADIITPLANTFRDNDYEIAPVLTQLFKSSHFFDADNTELTDDTRGGIIKSPLELMIGTLRFFKVDFGDTTDLEHLYKVYSSQILNMLQDEGLNIYEPFEVAGYSAYHQHPEYNRNWITPNNLGYRYKMIDDLIAGLYDEDNNDLNVRLDVMQLINDANYVSDPSNPNEILDMFITYLFPQPIRTERYNWFRDQVLLDSLSIANWSTEWSDYQSSNDDSAVRHQIEALVREMIQSPEYQLF